MEVQEFLKQVYLLKNCPLCEETPIIFTKSTNSLFLACKQCKLDFGMFVDDRNENIYLNNFHWQLSKKDSLYITYGGKFLLEPHNIYLPLFEVDYFKKFKTKYKDLILLS